MNKNELYRKLHEGRRVYGTLITSPSPRWLDYVSALGMDYVFIDLEHMPMDREKTSWMCHAYHQAGLAPLVRITGPDPYEACTVLDGGAAGIIVPYVETPEQVRELRGAIKLRPLKGERLLRIVSEKDDREEELVRYQDERSAENIFVVNIESVPALENLDAILREPDLDAVLIGPHDLSTSMGIPEQYFHPEFEKTVLSIIKKVRARSMAVGFHCTYPEGLEQQVRWAEAGANLILHLADVIAFTHAMKNDLEFLKKKLGDGREDTETGRINI